MGYKLPNFGEMAEWSIALDLKSSDCHRSVGSNPTLSVILWGKGGNEVLWALIL